MRRAGQISAGVLKGARIPTTKDRWPGAKRGLKVGTWKLPPSIKSKIIIFGKFMPFSMDNGDGGGHRSEGMWSKEDLERFEKIREAGRQACRNQKAPDTNPNDPQTIEWYEWEEGWKEVNNSALQVLEKDLEDGS